LTSPFFTESVFIFPVLFYPQINPNPLPYEEKVFRSIFLTTLLGRAAVRGFIKTTNQRFNHIGPIKSVIRVAVHG